MTVVRENPVLPLGTRHQPFLITLSSLYLNILYFLFPPFFFNVSIANFVQGSPCTPQFITIYRLSVCCLSNSKGLVPTAVQGSPARLSYLI